MLEACRAQNDFQSAYHLLVNTTGFCSVSSSKNNNCEKSGSTVHVSYMTKRICMHEIFGDLILWKKVMTIHQSDSVRDRGTNNVGNEKKGTEPNENDEYEAAVSTLYDMLGAYGMQSDDLAQFASRISEEKFYSTERKKSY